MICEKEPFIKSRSWIATSEASIRKAFESPTPLDLALFLLDIMRKSQQTKDRPCQAASATALGTGTSPGI